MLDSLYCSDCCAGLIARLYLIQTWCQAGYFRLVQFYYIVAALIKKKNQVYALYISKESLY